MADQILLNVRVDSSKATGDIKKFSATTKSEMAAVERTTTGSLGAVNKSTKSMGQSFAGAGASISAANGALQLMGRQGPPALQTIAAGAASVAVSGFGPLSIAIAAATTALSFFLSESKEADKALDATSGALKRQREELEKLQDVRRSARLTRLATDLGIPTSEAARDERYSLASERIRELERAKAVTQESIRYLESQKAVHDYIKRNNLVGEATIGVDVKLREQADERRNALEEINNQLAEEHRISNVLVDIATDEATQRARTTEQIRKQVGAARELKTTWRDIADTMREIPRGELIGRMISDFNRGRSVLEDRPIRLGAAPTGAGFLSEVEAQAKSDAARNRLAERLARERSGVTMEGLLGVDGDTADTTPRISQLEADSQSRASSLTGNIASGLNQALQSEDYTNVGRNIAGSIVTALNQAVLEGALEGLGVKDAVSSGFSAIGSAFTGGGDAPVEATG